MKINQEAWIAGNATVLGDVTIGKGSSVFFHSTIRGDAAKIEIGECTNIQDNCVLHTDLEHPQKIGDYVTIGHGAIIHCAEIGDGSLIGMGAILLTDAIIGKNCIIGAGALIPQGMVVPDCSVVIGQPGKIRRQITKEEVEGNRKNALFYMDEAMKYAKMKM